MAQTATAVSKIFVYGVNVDGTLWSVHEHDIYPGSGVRGALSGYRAYEGNRRHVEDALNDGVPACAAWDGNRYVFSPVALDLATGKAA